VKLVLTIAVRDEADIIDINLAYHLNNGVDFVIATDNGSVDGTRDVLERYRREGHLVLLDTTESHVACHGRWITQMARMAATDHGADWVINTDADEFWWPLEGSLKDIFAAVGPGYGAVAAPRPEYLPTRDDDGPFLDRLAVRERRSRTAPKLAHRASEHAIVRTGSHAVRDERVKARDWGRATLRLGESDWGVGPADPFLPAPWWPARIYHYPVRGWEQFKLRTTHLVDDPDPLGTRRRMLNERVEQGGLREMYESLIPDESMVAAGLERGLFVRDTRLRDFIAGTPPPALSAEELAAEREELELDVALAMSNWHRRHAAMLEKAEVKRDSARRRADKFKVRSERLKFRIETMEQSRWWRLRNMLSRAPGIGELARRRNGRRR
jgi:hypothetical protein